MCAGGEHSPDSHVKKPLESRARASQENTLSKPLLSLPPWIKLREMKITAFAGHLGAASPLLLQLKLLFRSVSSFCSHSPPKSPQNSKVTLRLSFRCWERKLAISAFRRNSAWSPGVSVPARQGSQGSGVLRSPPGGGAHRGSRRASGRQVGEGGL